MSTEIRRVEREGRKAESFKKRRECGERVRAKRRRVFEIARRLEKRREMSDFSRGGKGRKNDAAAATFGAGAGFYQKVFANWWVKWHPHDLARISMFFGIFRQPG